jgi:uncharacterized protein (TIGR01777 family)
MKVAISGVTGLIGEPLRKSFAADGFEVLALTRQRAMPPLRTITWDIQKGRFDASALEGIDVVVHLAGEPVAQRWTDRSKQAIRDSRVKGTRLLVEGLKSLSKRPRVLVSASAVGFYGDGGDRELDESSPAGAGFLADVCQEWEHAAMDALGLGIRAAVIRIGIVLTTRGGALGKMLLPFKLGLGGPVGRGTQWMPWIHIDDLVAAFRHVVSNEDIVGAVNATTPNPVTNAEFSRALGKALHRPAVLPAPAFALKLVLGQMSEIVLDGQRALPTKLVQSGFEFRHTEIEEALGDVLKNDR